MFFLCFQLVGQFHVGIFFALLFHIGIGLFFFLGKSEPRNRQKKSQRRIEGEEKPVTSRPDCQRHKLEFTRQHAIWKGSKKPQELVIKTGTIEKIITTYKSCLSSTSGWLINFFLVRNPNLNLYLPRASILGFWGVDPKFIHISDVLTAGVLTLGEMIFEFS